MRNKQNIMLRRWNHKNIWRKVSNTT